LLLASYHV